MSDSRPFFAYLDLQGNRWVIPAKEGGPKVTLAHGYYKTLADAWTKPMAQYNEVTMDYNSLPPDVKARVDANCNEASFYPNC